MKPVCKAVIGAAALMPGAVLAEASNFNFVEAKFLTGEVGVIHSFSPRFAGVAELSSEDDGHTIGLGLRFYF
jgi:hypothetical protein